MVVVVVDEVLDEVEVVSAIVVVVLLVVEVVALVGEESTEAGTAPVLGGAGVSASPERTVDRTATSVVRTLVGLLTELEAVVVGSEGLVFVDRTASAVLTVSGESTELDVVSIDATPRTDGPFSGPRA